MPFIARTTWQGPELRLEVRLPGFPSEALAEAHALDSVELLLRGAQFVLLSDDGTEHYLFTENLTLSGPEERSLEEVLEELARAHPGSPLSFQRLSHGVEREENVSAEERLPPVG